MLVLSRKRNETIVIGGQIRVTVVRIDSNAIRLGIEAPGDVPIYREEVIARLDHHSPALLSDEPATLS